MKEEKTLTQNPSGELIDKKGLIHKVPENWELLPPGDAGLTRRVKKLGSSWKVEKKRGRRTFSQGIYAPKDNIEMARWEINRERNSPQYQRKLEKARDNRKEKQQEYSKEFFQAVLNFLNFDKKWKELENRLAELITESIVEVGSGTVARTKMIPIEQRAGSAVIAWFRHQTTPYDLMSVARVKGMRRDIRKKLAFESKLLLEQYRSGEEIDETKCPLQHALKKYNKE